MRPRQWIKNLLVFFAPATAGLLGHPGVLGRCSLCAVAFLGASAGTYLLNDVIDAPRDRLHPDKMLRPVASGDLSAPFAATIGSAALTISLVASWFIGGGRLLSVIAVYSALSVAYSIRLKHVPVIELACVAAGFVLRAVAGGVALHIPISLWFILVTSAGSLLVVTGKRSSELSLLGESAAEHRPVLKAYPPVFLRTVRLVALVVAAMSYALWAFERAANLDLGHGDFDNAMFQLSVLPFVVGLLSLELAIERGHGGAPEELAFRDRGLQALGLACVALVAVGIYV